MKLHDLRPAPGSRTERTRVGRGISAGKGKTAGRGTKGQKARAGVSIPAWFEGGQTPIHLRVPKLRGFKVRGRPDYEVVNVGALSRAAEAGRFVGHDGPEGEEPTTATRSRKSSAAAPITVNADTMHGAGLVRRTRHPVKVLGDGEVTRALFVVADAFTRSAREKIEAAGGTAMLLEVPGEELPALGVDRAARRERRQDRAAAADEATGAAGGDETQDDETATAAVPQDEGRSASAEVGTAARGRTSRTRKVDRPEVEPSEEAPGAVPADAEGTAGGDAADRESDEG
jgi:large subunit ribosomal protein L15